jgi:hypothetical protein
LVVAVVDEVAAIVLVVDEAGTLSTDSDPPPQETIKKELTHAK